MPILIVFTLIIWMMLSIPGLVVSILMMLIHNAMLPLGVSPIKMTLNEIILLMLAGPFGSLLAVMVVARRM